MNVGEMKLIWTDQNNCARFPTHSEIFTCLHDALEKAGTVHREGGVNQRLINWFGEDVCPPDQLEQVAMLRAAHQIMEAGKLSMQNLPVWGVM